MGFGGADGSVFERAPVLRHLAAGDLFKGSVDEAEFADGEVVVFIAYGWAEGTALDGARGVEVAGAGGGVKDGAGFVVGEVFEELFVMRLGEEQPGDGVAGEVRGEAFAGALGAAADARGYGGVGCGECIAERSGVKLRDGEDADAALVTAGAAGQPGTGALHAGGECGVDDGEEGKQGVESRCREEKTQEAQVEATLPTRNVVR